MANVLHSTLTGADLHESKGASSASLGQVAIATGSGTAVFGTLAYSQISGTPTLGTLAALNIAPIANGGTGATTAVAGLAALGGKPSAGVTDASSAAAGVVGEVLTSTGAGVAMTSGTFYDIATITLTAGDWELKSVGQFATTTSSVFSIVQLGSSLTSATLPAFPYRFQIATGATSSDVHTDAPIRRVNITTSTTFYLVARCVYTTGSVTGTGYFEARRIR